MTMRGASSTYSTTPRGWLGDDMTTDADLAAFPDEERVSAYAREALAWAVDRGLINGVAQGGESWLEPRAGATRAQVATILMRFLKQK